MTFTNRVALIPAGNRNRPGRKLDGGLPAYITIHETGNTDVGTDAEMHRDFVFAGGGREGVSFHYVVDDYESIQLLPDDEVAWHAGDGAHGPGNSTSLAVEACVNSDGSFEQTRLNLVRLVTRLMLVHDIPASRVVQHNHWSGKDCPHFLRRNGWDRLILQLLSATVGERRFPTGFAIRGALRAYFEQNGDVPVFGMPISRIEEMTIPGVGPLTVQWFERSRLEIHEDGTIMRGLVGAEAYEAYSGYVKLERGELGIGVKPMEADP